MYLRVIYSRNCIYLFLKCMESTGGEKNACVCSVKCEASGAHMHM